MPEFLLRLWNVYSFFVIYANIDGFDPAAFLDEPGDLDHADLSRSRGWRPVSERSELDRWMLAELSATSAAVVERMDSFDHFAAAGRISALVEASSNWFVRRSRDRFWSPGRADGGPGTDRDKLDAYFRHTILDEEARVRFGQLFRQRWTQRFPLSERQDLFVASGDIFRFVLDVLTPAEQPDPAAAFAAIASSRPIAPSCHCSASATPMVPHRACCAPR